jgi:hypothetical protein
LPLLGSARYRLSGGNNAPSYRWNHGRVWYVYSAQIALGRVFAAC